jgi:CIC family chloride channel protein
VGKSILPLALVSCVAGAFTGLLVAVFRLSLRRADHWRDALLAHANGWPVAGFLFTVVLVAAAASLAAWLVRRFSPFAAGSGIPRVEAVLRGEMRPAPFSLLPVKFVGGLLAIGGGLALGREGPSVQMGANIGMFLGRKLRLSTTDCMALMAACGGAGIATAFNAPIAGSVFVLEELVRRFDTRIAIAALGSSCCAIAVARLFLGRTPDFQVGALSFSDVGSGFLFLILGAVAGFLGIAYNRTLLGTISLADRIRWPIEMRAAVIGAIVGAVAWFAPDLVGGGDAITQRMLSTGEGLGTLGGVLLLRFLLGPLSYAAGTPGGLFAPMLVLGAQLGLLFSAFAAFAFPHIVVAPTAFTVVAMAAFFTAVVRAPVTGIILVIELTANFTQLMPMLWACFAAMVVPTLFGNRPIYESLSKPAVQEERGGE